MTRSGVDRSRGALRRRRGARAGLPECRAGAPRGPRRSRRQAPRSRRSRSTASAMLDAIGRLQADRSELVPTRCARHEAAHRQPNQFGEDGRFNLSARQSRLGVRASMPTDNGVRQRPVRVRLVRHRRGRRPDHDPPAPRVGTVEAHSAAAMTNSPFMDADVFPNSLEYWGPNGMLFFRNAQVFYESFNDGSSNARIAVEAPGASGDGGVSLPIASSSRTSKRVSRRLTSPATIASGGSGATSSSAARCATSSTTTCCRTTPFNLSGQRLGLGHRRQHQRQARQDRRPAGAADRRCRRRELLQRRAD